VLTTQHPLSAEVGTNFADKRRSLGGIVRLQVALLIIKPIHNWVSNFRQTGFVLKWKSTGWPRTATERETVRASTQQSPWCSARKHVDTLWLSDAWRILHRDFRMYPYKIVVVQELSERDCETHTILCRELLQNVPHTAVLLFTDEAYFHLSGTVNKQNFRHWSHNNPRELH
jgi:hypothetical protein